jgi:hypothetical protein
MAMPTAVNDQITDSVTQSGVKVVGSAPAVALSALFQASAHSLGLAAQNATVAQQQLNVVADAVTAKCVQLLVGGK